MPPEEQARRARQRELRELAMKLRAEGKNYRPPRKTADKDKVKDDNKRAKTGVKGDKGDRKGNAQHNQAQAETADYEETGSRLDTAPQVGCCIIIDAARKTGGVDMAQTDHTAA